MRILGSGYPAIDLRGACVLITGGGRGIGRATAASFAAKGARMVLADVDKPAADDAAAAIGARAFELDVRSRDQWDEVVAAVGGIDVLVNNAGVMPAGAFLTEPDAVGRATLDINVWGLIHGMRAVAPGMIERGRGHIVNVASLAGKVPIPGLAVYKASKFAAVGLSAATRLEFAGQGVSVSCVLPSAVRTRLSSDCGSATACRPSTRRTSPPPSCAPAPPAEPKWPCRATSARWTSRWPQRRNARCAWSAASSTATAPCARPTRGLARSTSERCAPSTDRTKSGPGGGVPGRVGGGVGRGGPPGGRGARAAPR